MANDNFLGELKDAYKNYKKKNYRFGKYTKGEQIKEEFSNGKIFVLKGGGILIWICCIIMLILSVFCGYAIVWGSVLLAQGEITAVPIPFLLFVLIFIGIIAFVPTIILFLSFRMFLVISPSGVYYRRIFKTGAFQWNDVKDYEAHTEILKAGKRHYKVPIPIAQVTIFLLNDKKVRFASKGYRGKEFGVGVKNYLFMRLFQIYAELGKG